MAIARSVREGKARAAIKERKQNMILLADHAAASKVATAKAARAATVAVHAEQGAEQDAGQSTSVANLATPPRPAGMSQVYVQTKESAYHHTTM